MTSNKIIHYNSFLNKLDCIKIIDFVNNYMSINYQYNENLFNTLLCEHIEDNIILDILQKNIFQIGNIIKNVYDIKLKLFPSKAILFKYNNITNFDFDNIFYNCKYFKFASILYLNDDDETNSIDFFNSNCKFNVNIGDIVCFQKIEKHKYKIHNDLSQKMLLFICYSDTELLNIFKKKIEVSNINRCTLFNLYIQPNIDLNKIVFQSNFLNDLEIQNINDASKLLKQSTIQSYTINEQIRKSKTSWLDNNEFNWLYNKIFDFAYEINKYNWNFQIFGAIDPIQYTEYNIGDFYDWHTDIGDKEMQYRKLSVVICITDDYDGGEIILFNSSKSQKYKLKKGDLIIFPSFVLHKVSKIKKGVRKSLVMWICGNNFI